MTNSRHVRGFRNLDAQDEFIEKAKRTKLTGYGIRTQDNTREVYSIEDSKKVYEEFIQHKHDSYIPDFTRETKIMPERCGLSTFPMVRYDVASERMMNDKTLKLLYVQKEGELRKRIGREMPYGQPVISHEFMEDALYSAADKHKTEWEIVPEITYDDKKGYRRYWGILSKRLDREIKNSFRSGDVVRVGALVRNGIAENIAVGFDVFTYALVCSNGSIGRGKELGSESWKHIGEASKLQERIQQGLEEIFNIGEKQLDIYEKANDILMTEDHLKRIWNHTKIADKYYDENYFELIPEAENKRKVVDIRLVKSDISLWEGYNALTRDLWHSDDKGFAARTKLLRNLNTELVAIVNTHRRVSA